MEQNLTQNINKVEINIKICHITCSVSRDFNPKDNNIIFYFSNNI